MVPVIEKSILLTSLQSAGLGIIVGSLFAFFGFNPPSPNNLAGILGIGGIYIGWVLIGYFMK